MPSFLVLENGESLKNLGTSVNVFTLGLNHTAKLYFEISQKKEKDNFLHQVYNGTSKSLLIGMFIPFSSSSPDLRLPPLLPGSLL